MLPFYLSFIADLFKGRLADVGLKSPELSKESLAGVLEDSKILSSTSFQIRKGSFLEVFQKYVSENILPLFDQLSLEFFNADVSERSKEVEKVFEKRLLSHQVIGRFLSTASYEEAQDMLANIFHRVDPNAENILVQSAREADAETKSLIRKNYPKGFVRFQINRSLLGGMRVYKDSMVVDASWMGKLMAMSQIHN